MWQNCSLVQNWEKEDNIQTTHLTEGFYCSRSESAFFGQCFQLIQLMKKDPEKGLESVFLDNIIHVFKCWQKSFCTSPKQTPAIFGTCFHEDTTQNWVKSSTSANIASCVISSLYIWKRRLNAMLLIQDVPDLMSLIIKPQNSFNPAQLMIVVAWWKRWSLSSF